MASDVQSGGTAKGPPTVFVNVDPWENEVASETPFYLEGADHLAIQRMSESEVHFIEWVDDNFSDRCLSCGREFSFFFRRHHCRRCGNLICEDCSRNHEVDKEQRVCVTCFDNPQFVEQMASVVGEAELATNEDCTQENANSLDPKASCVSALADLPEDKWT